MKKIAHTLFLLVLAHESVAFAAGGLFRVVSIRGAKPLARVFKRAFRTSEPFGMVPRTPLGAEASHVYCGHGDGFVLLHPNEVSRRRDLNEQLLSYAGKTDWEGVRSCLSSGADPYFVDPKTGNSIYHILATSPYEESARTILLDLTNRNLGDSRALNKRGLSPYQLGFREGAVQLYSILPWTK